MKIYIKQNRNNNNNSEKKSKIIYTITGIEYLNENYFQKLCLELQLLIIIYEIIFKLKKQNHGSTNM